ncbi:hypothetical protein V6N12_045420 [Hibiscus sabdariffa]|uniref:Uncharacterized protein n=1 Tax=Hibiscus sabdariffa TaxID=183260 RepID=A0ABR2G3S6_9ROSI
MDQCTVAYGYNPSKISEKARPAASVRPSANLHVKQPASIYHQLSLATTLDEEPIAPEDTIEPVQQPAEQPA